MSFEKLAEGFPKDLELGRYYSIFLGDAILIVGQKFVDQPTHHFGHYIAFAGTYILQFSLVTNTWHHFEFSALSEEENLSEVLFAANGKLHILLYTNFGAIEYKKLYRLEGETFEEVPLEVPETIATDSQTRVEILSAEGALSDGRKVLITSDSGEIIIYGLSLDGGASIAEIGRITSESNPLRGQATTGTILNDKVLISYGVHGCGFRWQNGRFFVFNTADGTLEDINPVGEWTSLPPFCFTGPELTSANPETGSWFIATGSVQVGMCDSKHCGDVWVLKDAFTKPADAKFEKLSLFLEKGAYVVDGLNIYKITADDVSKLTLESA